MLLCKIAICRLVLVDIVLVVVVVVVYFYPLAFLIPHGWTRTRR